MKLVLNIFVTELVTLIEMVTICCFDVLDEVLHAHPRPPMTPKVGERSKPLKVLVLV